MTAIMTKLGATSRMQAAGIAAARGLMEEQMVDVHASLVARASPIEMRMQYA
jgi:hypothetical protein